MEFTEKHPDIQEAGGSFPLHGYEVFSQSSTPHRRRGIVDNSATSTVTLAFVRKDLLTRQNDITDVNTPSQEHVSTTTMVGDHRLTVNNVYWSPNQPSALCLRYTPSHLLRVLGILSSSLVTSTFILRGVTIVWYQSAINW
ncbi:hypothetical protein HPB48_022194 [Haemaphysalis longicornis]|uniref:Uncharacterized protein n=1 Tax=Haemaphysalis longicornis TaxID=44386 RepID=A0A9J6H2Q0_HAELO|nr:hypothetical protein HPB48_022194 [Haemaphysalis longicornis]